MGKVNFSGPVYGAKGLLWNPFAANTSSGASTQIVAVTRVPVYEDWYVTECVYNCSTCSTGSVAASSVAQFVIKDDGTNLHAVSVITDTNAATLVTITPDAGEYEGKRIAAGSTLTFEIMPGSSAVAAQSARAELRGYIRFISSTRAES